MSYDDTPDDSVSAWRRKVVTFIAIAALWMIGLGLMLSGWSALLRIIGFWVVIGGLAGSVLYLTFDFARMVVGRAWPEFHGDREIAVTLAFLVAFVMSPGAVSDLSHGVSGLGRGLIFEGPYLASASTDNTKAPAQLYACIAATDACQYRKEQSKPSEKAKGDAPQQEPQPTPAPNIDASWASFVIALTFTLLVARGLRSARRDFFMKLTAQTRGSRPPSGGAEGGSPPRFVSQVLMNYPTWVAFCIYALILIPATYLAVGSLLYLRLDTPSADLAALTRELDDAERQAMAAPGVSVDITRLRADLGRLEKLPAKGADKITSESEKALKQGAAYNTELTDGRARYRQQALHYASDYKRRATAAQFDDYKAVQLARYQAAIRDTRAAAAPCQEGLATVARQVVVVQKAQDAPTSGPRDAAPSPDQTVVNGALQSQVDSLRNRLTEASMACATSTVAFTPAAKPTDVQGDCADLADLKPPSCERPRPQFPEAMYQWLAASSDATVLIVGLVGFGLFGSAIRMMGRVDSPNVSESAVQTARDNAYQARQAVTVPENAYKAARAKLESQREQSKGVAATFDQCSAAVTANTRAIVAAEATLADLGVKLAAARAAHSVAEEAATTLRASYQALPEAQRTEALASSLKVAEDKTEVAAKAVQAIETEVQDARTALDQLHNAKAEADAALDKARTALATAQADDVNLLKEAQTAEAEWKKAEEKAVTAESYHQQLRALLVSDRTNIVVQRDRSGGGTEFTISGAPAKVLVQGLGAAFTTFLAGQASVQILTTGGRTNAYSLLLSCFVGAVFAEEIWRWARRYLPSDTPPPPAGSVTSESASASQAPAG